MENGQLLGIVIGALCGFGSGILFYAIGVRGARQEKTMNFWAGQTVAPESVTDIPAYNQACAKLWKRFSIPCWMFGILSLLLPLGNWTVVVGLAILVLWGTVGIWWLIKSYKRIEKQYIASAIDNRK